MALRYSCTNAAVVTGGTQFNHGLVNQSTGAIIAPTEWWFNSRTAQTVCGGIYLTAAPTTSSLTLAMSSASGTADVFCAVSHSIIQ